MVILLNEKMWPFQSQLNVSTQSRDVCQSSNSLVGKGEISKQVFGWPAMFLFAILIGIIKLLSFKILKSINSQSLIKLTFLDVSSLIF